MATMTRAAALMLGWLLCLAASAIAGDGPHGGTLVSSGHHRLEVVAGAGGLEVYVTGEDGNPEETANAMASAVVLADGKTARIALSPAGGHVLKGTGDVTIGKGATIVLTLTMPGHAPEQSRLQID
jgi:hypothetical protein